MASFGENLRREREMRGVTLQEISSATKISVRFLQALENEQFDRVPGGIFTRSFIRTYARYLGLDEDQVLAEYRLAVPSSAEFDLSRLTMSKPDTHPNRARGPAAALLLAAVLLGGGYLLHRYARRASEPPASPAPAPTAPASNAAGGSPSNSSLPAVAEPAKVAAAPVPGASGSGQTQQASVQTAATGNEAAPPTAPSPEEGLVLQIAATEQSWVAIEADHKTVLQRVFEAGEVKSVRARESVDVTTGNALGIVLTLNGETLQPLGRHGEVKSVHLTRNDVKKSSP
jgi:cytoskeleton protein RodZ